MIITLMNNTSEYNALNKSLNEVVTIEGVLRDESSIIDPVIKTSNIDNYVGTINYAFIPNFNRYYFITNVESVQNNIWKISMHVDVLYTYRYEIEHNHAIIERNETDYDLKLNDGLFKTQQNPRIAQFPFPNGFDHWDFVLAVAGN